MTDVFSHEGQKHLCDSYWQSRVYAVAQKVAGLIGQESLERLLQLATRHPGILC